jgi:reactive intermediate/imine deaminase
VDKVMPLKEVIHTDKAPTALGVYSQALRIGQVIYCSGQIGLNPKTMQLVNETFDLELEQVFKNLEAVVLAAGASLKEIVKLTIYLTDLSFFSKVNEKMTALFSQPYPTRTTIQVSALPKNAAIELDAILVLGPQHPGSMGE